MPAEDPFTVDVLRADGGKLASFTFPVDAIRFAALSHEPGFETFLRRVHDGAVRRFSPSSPPGAVLSWLSERTAG